MAAGDRRPVVLVVLDGWGYRPERDGNAIALATVPTWDRLWARAPRTLLDASGLAVGLPEGQMGNSEVGHLNLGAGRVVMQDLVRVSQAIKDRSFFQSPALLEACDAVKRSGGTLHVCGLLGDGGVHAHDAHAVAVVELARSRGVERVALHLFLDGRDTLPRSAAGFLQDLERRIAGRARIASVSGRYYAMDRDQRWPRTELAYRAMVDGTGPSVTSALASITTGYDNNVTDEFQLPVVVTQDGQPIAPMRDGDQLVCFNYRSDRMRQIVRALTQPGFTGFDTGRRPAIGVTTMTQYDQTFGVPVVFAPQSMARIVAEVVSGAGMTMFRTAETEKYPHVTYFFNGGEERPFKGEERQLVASQKVATYDLMPEMSAAGVTDTLVGAIEGRHHDFILCNYANGDMVGHSGSLPATIKAVECVDACLARVIASAEKAGARLLVTADHGNCEMMIDPATGGPHTAHTTNQVPFLLVDPDGDRPLRSGGALCDVGPTVLSLLGLDQPAEMTGTSLRRLEKTA
ncbi:MAG: 2,3-bisphosphoglycerate-independent phosphoglycerate mutase [Gemmatimonadetes bacterium]|nr:2,3-bisphosphoglycerate-independent phosphoglycerate mutase [Gemmatimonadota bacterium]